MSTRRQNDSRLRGFSQPVGSLLFALCLLSLLTPACAQSGRLTAEEILRRSLAAEHRTNMRGKEMALIEPRGMPSVHMVRKVTRTRDGWSLVRWLEPTSQHGIITLNDGQWTRCYIPGAKEITSNRSVPEPHDARAITRQWMLLLHNYRVRLEGKESIAGRPCYILAFTPKAGMSHTIRSWIDTQKFVTLSHRENDAGGHTLAFTMFTWVEFPGDIPAKEIRSPFPRSVTKVVSSPSQLFANIGLLRKATGFEVCVPYSMPAGYELERCELITTKGTQTSCLRYTDGLSSLSVYQSRAKETRPADFQACRTARHSFGDNMVNYASGSMNFMLIGRIEMKGMLVITNMLDTNRERTFLDTIARTFRMPASTLGGMRNLGMGIDTIDALLEINAQTRQPLSALINLYRDGYSWQSIAQKFKANAKHFVERVRFYEAR